MLCVLLLSRSRQPVEQSMSPLGWSLFTCEPRLSLTQELDASEKFKLPIACRSRVYLSLNPSLLTLNPNS